MVENNREAILVDCLSMVENNREAIQGVNAGAPEG
jgi:hypothetical protein